MSQHSTPIRNPAPHRGFNAKAREVLLDSPNVENSGMRRSGSDEEFLRRVGLIRFRRDGSESEEFESGGSTPAAIAKCENGFDALDDMPKLRSTNRKSLKPGHRLLADIGKTRSVGDLSKRIAVASNPIKTFPQRVTERSSICEVAKAEETTTADVCQQPNSSSKRNGQYKMQ
uniref:Uncharacterized protein n=1 Tax=Globodera rostochiensis TaxID=31243 RepID=A0A914HJ38_GLORO